MLVTDIEITDYRFCETKARHHATVGVTVKDRFITLLCQSDLPRDAGGRSRARAFVEDAVRQLRRMPEIRSGGAVIDFRAGFDPANLRSA
ncbi:MAG: hypothetical protein AB3N13_13510 [Arenibacterium sp.]